MAKYFVYPFAVSGDLGTAIPDPTQVSGSMSYQSGFPVNYERDLLTDPSALPIPRAQTNQLYNDITTALKQYQSLGVYDWVTAAQNDGTSLAYDIYARVRYNPGSPGTPGAGNFVYENQVQGNTATPGTDGSWVIISGGSAIPGTVIDFAGTSAPAGYLPCDGSMPTVSRTTYANLFSAIGTTWGAGNGTTTFGLPNLARRVTMGAGGSGTGTIGATVGSIGGEEAHVQSLAELASHLHAFVASGTLGEPNNGAGPSGSTDVGTVIPGGTQTLAAGSSAAANVIQPSAILLKCIKY